MIVEKLEADRAKLTALSPEVFRHLYEAFLALEKRLAYADGKLTAVGQARPACQRLQTSPGVGPVRATALIAAVGDVTPFKHGRRLAAGLGPAGALPRREATARGPRPAGSTRSLVSAVGG
jgi:transposase